MKSVTRLSPHIIAESFVFLLVQGTATFSSGNKHQIRDICLLLHFNHDDYDCRKISYPANRKPQPFLAKIFCNSYIRCLSGFVKVTFSVNSYSQQKK